MDGKSLTQVLALMRRVQGDRSAKEFAQSLGVSAQYLSDVYNRRVAPGPRLLQAIGIEKIVTYRKKP